MKAVDGGILLKLTTHFVDASLAPDLLLYLYYKSYLSYVLSES